MLLSDIEIHLLTKQDSKPKGLALIITNSYGGQRFNPACHKDGEIMKELFEDTFKFACYWKKDCSDFQMKDLIDQVATCDYTAEYGKHIQYIAVVFSGHGEDGTILSNDCNGYVRVQEDIIDPLNMLKTSENKEIIKLFFIDASRGDGKMIAPESIVHPSSKYLVAFSTSRGFPAYTRRDGEGSLWMFAVAKHLKVETEETIYNAIEHANEEIRSSFHKRQLPITYAIGGCGTIKLHFDHLPPPPVASPEPKPPLGNTYNWWIICTLVCVAPVIVAAVIMVAVIVAALLLPGGIGPAALSPSAVSSLSRTLSQPTGIQSPVITQHTCRAQGPVFPPRSIVIPLPTTTTTEGRILSANDLLRKAKKIITSTPRFCFCLKLPMVHCDRIEREKHDVWEKIREISSIWFNDTPYPTWEPVVKALICMGKRGAAS